VLDPVRHLLDLARFAVTRPQQEARDRDALAELQRVPVDVPAGLDVEWLGVAGFRLTFEGQTLILDPYLSRRTFGEIVRRRPILPDPAALERHLRDAGNVVGVAVGHTHFDHAVDAPAVAARYQAPALGSSSLTTLMRLHGLDGLAVDVEPYRRYDVGPFGVTFVPSAHSKILLGLAVPYPGELTCDRLDALTADAYRCGQAWGIHIEVGGAKVYHQGSADLVDDAVRHSGVDLFLAGVAGREFTHDYWTRILTRLEPRSVLICHHDDFFVPLDRPMRFAPNVHLERVAEEIAAVDPDVEVGAPPLGQPVS
jgi:L-ascorbate metabolism protein UlaG (beta-lactamase superfamily)